jgi:hypothetical protein
MKVPSLTLDGGSSNSIAGVQHGLDASAQYGVWIRVLLVGAVVAQVVANVLNWGRTWTSVSNGDLHSWRNAWPSALAVTLVVAALTLVVLRRLWTREAREAFRYTFFVSPFDSLDGAAGANVRWAGRSASLSWLGRDLTERMCDGIRRLSVLEEEYVSATTPGARSHLHIRGSYALRSRAERPDGPPDVEVRAWVRIGPPGQPEVLAPPVNYTLENTQLELDDYERILDRLFFSVTTAIYSQIRSDIERKIAQLPGRRLKATAYLFEAEDYATSNTLDAYSAAEQLFQVAIDLFAPWATPLPPHGVRRQVLRVSRGLVHQWELFLRLNARWAPRFGRRYALLTQAQIGKAKTLLYRRQLGGISGQRIAPVFEAPKLLEKARDRADRLPEGVPGRESSRFQSRVLLALAVHLLGSPERAEPLIREARDIDPAHAHEDAVLAFVSAQVETHPVLRLQLTRAAVELDPKSQVARYSLALELEMIWRKLPTLEPTVATQVTDEYRRVIGLNPGIIAAWSNYSYVIWLVNDPDSRQLAVNALRRGLEYKEIKQARFVSDLDYGLARIAAENGDLKTAYRHFDEAVAAVLARDPHDANSETPEYWHRYLSPAMLARIKCYRDTVLSHISDISEQRDADADADATSPYVRDAVASYVRTDYADALAADGLRRDDPLQLDRAEEEYRAAAELNDRFILPRYGLYRIHMARQETGRAAEVLGQIEDLDPDWPEGVLASAELKAESGDFEGSRRAIRKLLEHPWAGPGASPRLRIWRKKGTADPEHIAAFLLRSEKENPSLSPAQVEALVVWARVLADQCRNGDTRDVGAGIAAAGICRYVEKWYYPNYAKVHLIAMDAVRTILESGRDHVSRRLDDSRERVLETILLKANTLASTLGTDGEFARTALEADARSIEAWQHTRVPTDQQGTAAAVAARRIYARMIRSSWEGLVMLDPGARRIVKRLETLLAAEGLQSEANGISHPAGQTTRAVAHAK